RGAGYGGADGQTSVASGEGLALSARRLEGVRDAAVEEAAHEVVRRRVRRPEEAVVDERGARVEYVVDAGADGAPARHPGEGIAGEDVPGVVGAHRSRGGGVNAHGAARLLQGIAGRPRAETAGGRTALVEGAEEARVNPGADALVRPPHPGDELERRVHAANGGDVVGVLAVDHASVGQGAIELVEPGSIEEEVEPAVLGGQQVIERKVDAVGRVTAHVRIGVDDVDNAKVLIADDLVTVLRCLVRIGGIALTENERGADGANGLVY